MMSDRGRDPREGTLEQVGGRWQMRFVRRLPHKPEKVWRALTEEEHLAAWFPTTIEGERKVGAPLRFAFRGSDYPPQTGELLAYDPPSLLEFSWGGPPDGVVGRQEIVRVELRAEPGGCLLTFITTYDEVGKSARDAAGWHVCFDLLELELKGEKPSWKQPDRWKPLNAQYAELFGPEAATIGPPTEFEDYH